MNLKHTAAAMFACCLLAGAPAAVSAQTVSPYATGAGNPTSLSFNTAGELFFGQVYAADVRRVPAGGGVGSYYLTKPSGNMGAVIGPDNALYIPIMNGDVIRYAPGSTTPDPVSYATGASTSFYTNLAFDPSGRLYVIGYEDNKVYRIPAGGGPAAVFGTISTGEGPLGIVINSAGSVFIATQISGNVKTIPSTGGPATVFGVNAPQAYGIAVSDTGDIYVSTQNEGVRKIPAAGGAAAPFATVSGTPTGLTIRNNVLYVGTSNGAVSQVSIPALTPPAPVPTMTEWAMILFGTILAGCAALYIQRRRLIA